MHKCISYAIGVVNLICLGLSFFEWENPAISDALSFIGTLGILLHSGYRIYKQHELAEEDNESSEGA